MNHAAQGLDVYFDADLVGHLYDTTPLSFQYAAVWLNRGAMQIANITLGEGINQTPSVAAFFENLLPEGELRHYLLGTRKISTLFGLLHAVAGDTAGGFVLQPQGVPLQAHRYRASSWQHIAAELKANSGAAIKGKDARISLAGAQDKFSVALFADAQPHLGIGTSPSTHIVKPDIARLHGVWASAVNETLVMQTAYACDLGVASVFFEPTTRSCVVERFDRIVQSRKSIKRVLQYDLCQLSSLPSAKKYESEGGPSLKDCADLIRKYSTEPATDLKRLLGWVFFNLYTGNNDSHAKNLSLYNPPGQGVRLTPFYDLMCTRIYPGLSSHFAFDIGGTTHPGEITRSHIDMMAQRLGIRTKFAMDVGVKLGLRLPVALHASASALRPYLSPKDAVMAQRLIQYIQRVCTQTRKRLA